MVTSELANIITDPIARVRMAEYRKIVPEPDAIGRAILYAIEQLDDVDVNDIMVWPLKSQVRQV